MEEMKKELNCEFATIVSTGEKPSAEIHLCGFDRGNGIAVTGQQSGNGMALATMICSLISDLLNNMRKKGDGLAAAAFVEFVEMVGKAVAESAGREIVLASALLNSPDSVKIVTGDEIGDMKPEDFLSMMMGDDEGEEEDEDRASSDKKGETTMERNIEFVTMVSTGEKPDCEIHLVGFNEKDGMECCTQLTGSLGDHVNLTCGLIGKMLDILKAKGGVIGQAMLVEEISKAITENCAKEALELAKTLKSRKPSKDDIEKLVEAVKDEAKRLGLVDDEGAES